MTVEAATYISQLNATYPASGDLKSEGDDHMRLIKSAVKATFPNLTASSVTASTVELNYVTGATSSIQGQINTEITNRTNSDELKAPIASPTFTGTVTIPAGASITGYSPLASPALTGVPTAPTATAGIATDQIATTAFVAATAMSSVLPGQVGNAGKFLTTSGTNASWSPAVDSINGATGAVTDIADLTTVQTLTNKTMQSCTVDGTNAIGFRNIPQLDKTANYPLVLDDAGKHVHKGGTTAFTVTIPANSAVAFPVGTAITFVNSAASGGMTISITTDTMKLAVSGNTASRTLAAYGVATAVKVKSTEWVISGMGLT
jgi:hypothetical protein